MIKEGISRAAMILGFLFTFHIEPWYFVLFIVPLVFRIFDAPYGIDPMIYSEIGKLIFDMIAHISYFTYIILSVYLFQVNLGLWWVGLIVGFFVVQLLGLLYPRRWLHERMSGRL